MRIAIVGAGISGLAAAYFLHRTHEIVLFEKEPRLGGHAHTVAVPGPDGRERALDTGFLVYNERTYPHFTRLLAELGVATQPSEMSLSVACRRCGIEYSGRSLRGLLGARHALRPAFHGMLRDVLRFNREGVAAADGAPGADETLLDLVRRRGYSDAFVRHYLIPMGAAIWSARTATFERFPARYFLRFFANHGLLSVRDHPTWRTVVGGSREYVRALVRPFADRVRSATPVAGIARTPAGVVLELAGGTRETFDRVVVAAHADQALALLRDASPEERDALAAIPYAANEAVLHTDERLLPRRPAARASWNVHLDDCRASAAPLSMTYFLNRLQRLDGETAYAVTLNDTGRIDPERVLARIPYEHPVYTHETLRAQARLRALAGARGTYFCGAYAGYGFHEDGLRSALEVVEALAAERAAA